MTHPRKTLKAPPREPDAIVQPYSWFQKAMFAAAGIGGFMAWMIVWPTL